MHYSSWHIPDLILHLGPAAEFQEFLKYLWIIMVYAVVEIEVGGADILMNLVSVRLCVHVCWVHPWFVCIHTCVRSLHTDMEFDNKEEAYDFQFVKWMTKTKVLLKVNMLPFKQWNMYDTTLLAVCVYVYVPCLSITHTLMKHTLHTHSNNTHNRPHMHQCMYTFTMHTHIQCTHIYMYKNMHIHTQCTHTRAPTHTHTHTHIHFRAWLLFHPLPSTVKSTVISLAN